VEPLRRPDAQPCGDIARSRRPSASPKARRSSSISATHCATGSPRSRTSRRRAALYATLTPTSRRSRTVNSPESQYRCSTSAHDRKRAGRATEIGVRLDFPDVPGWPNVPENRA
jgi:hypothetical protein